MKKNKEDKVMKKEQQQKLTKEQKREIEYTRRREKMTLFKEEFLQKYTCYTGTEVDFVLGMIDRYGPDKILKDFRDLGLSKAGHRSTATGLRKNYTEKELQDYKIGNLVKFSVFGKKYIVEKMEGEEIKCIALSDGAEKFFPKNQTALQQIKVNNTKVQ